MVRRCARCSPLNRSQTKLRSPLTRTDQPSPSHLAAAAPSAAAHIGVLRVFQQEGIPIDYIAGTSLGSTIGGMYCAGLRVDQIDNLMVSGKLRRVIMPSLATVIGAQVVHHLEFWRHSYGGLLTQRRFKHFIRKYCGDKEQFGKSRRSFHCGRGQFA